MSKLTTAELRYLERLKHQIDRDEAMMRRQRGLRAIMSALRGGEPAK